MVEPVKTSKEATDASVDQDFWGNTAKLVGISNSLKFFQKLRVHALCFPKCK